MARVADYSAGKPGAAALKAHGYIGAVRYIGFTNPSDPRTRKCTTAAELRDFTQHGLGMALVFESAATDWRHGYQAGHQNMRRSLDHAYEIGWPADNRPIYMAVDQDVVTPGEFAAAMDYLNGAAAAHKGLSSTGPYGEYDVCARSSEAGFQWQWQCRAWSGNRTYPDRHFRPARLYQYYGHPETGPAGGPGPNLVVGGIECDTNEVLHDDWGQHIMTSPKEIWEFEFGPRNQDGTPTDDFGAANIHLETAKYAAKAAEAEGKAANEKLDELLQRTPGGGPLDYDLLAAALIRQGLAFPSAGEIASASALATVEELKKEGN